MNFFYDALVPFGERWVIHMKVLYFTNIPVPYRMQFFNELGKYCELTVMMESEYAGNLNADWLKRFKVRNYEYIVLPKIGRTSKTRINYGYAKKILKEKYDIIVVGSYYSLSAMIFITFLRKHRIPYILNSDGGFVKDDNKVTYAVKKHFISKAAAYITTGELTTKYLIHYGADSRFFNISFSSLTEKDISELGNQKYDKSFYRNKLGIEGEKVVLYAGQFIHRKGIDVLLNAIHTVKSRCVVYIVGGEPTDEYKAIVKKYNLNNVVFVGFQDKKGLVEYYRAADVFVLPTREDIWGLVVNEALGMGVPVITTNRCIAGVELINGVNGKIVPVGDSEKLAEAIDEIIGNDAGYHDRCKEAMKSVQNYTIENMAREHYNCFCEMKSK